MLYLCFRLFAMSSVFKPMKTFLQLFASPNLQSTFSCSARSSHIFSYFSSELGPVSYFLSRQQIKCSLSRQRMKLKCLTGRYFSTQAVELEKSGSNSNPAESDSVKKFSSFSSSGAKARVPKICPKMIIRTMFLISPKRPGGIRNKVQILPCRHRLC